MGNNGNGNGHSPFDPENPGQSVLEHKFNSELDKQEGSVSTGDAGENGVFTRVTPMTSSFLHRLATVDDNYDNEIKTGYYQNAQEARLFAAALYEAEYLGEDPRPIKLIHMAGNAGEKRGLVNSELDALSHSTFTFNNQGKGGHSRNKSSPLS